MGKALVIVESPTKAKTIARFLDDDYIVESSVGHIRDLPDSASEIPSEVKDKPWARLGINVEKGFEPLYVIPRDKQEQVKKLKKLLKQADELYLATDEDREGESISWHLLQVLEPKVPTHRLVFHEITKDAINHALQSPREVDTRLVSAQETRRVLDRLYGYEISPLLWRTIAPKLSAGRVQSVSVRMVVNRERERMAFRTAEFWDLEGQFQAATGSPFKAELVSVAGRRVAAGRDFDSATGQLAANRQDVLHLNRDGAEALQQRLDSATWRVVKVERKPYTTQPPAPFTTSTLQQEANRKLNLASRDTMRVAQSLYEQGFITYMRTDSTTLSDQALKAARAHIDKHYGSEYRPAEPRIYRSKVKNAQEAHEAIRPAGESFRTPASLQRELNDREFRLYEMIWKRTVASQMADARGQRMTLQVQGDDGLFQATGRTIEFPGFLRAYVEGRDDPGAELADQERILPTVAEGDSITCQGLAPQEHHTQPPARFSEASLIKELEKEGIGRPSTYASIIDTIIHRAYVVKKGSALVPTFVAFAVVQLLEQHFKHLVDQHFTADMENVLDAISNGDKESLPYLKDFYFGSGDHPGLAELLKAEIDPRRACTIPLGQSNGDEPINIRVGRYGPYLERNGERASLPADMAPDELTLERATDLLAKGNEPTVLGTHPESGQNVYVKTGRYGPYVQLGEQEDGKPKMKSLLPGQEPETLSLDDALALLSLPRNIGADPETDEDIIVDLGRYGPYARRGKETRTLPSVEALFTFTVPEAVALFKQERKARFGRASQLREVGEDKASGKTIALMNGRYGPYVTDGETNASVPRGMDPEQVTLDDALDLIRQRAAKGPPKKRRAAAAKKTGTTKRSAAAKKSGTKQAAGSGSKKAATKKSTAKKTGSPKKTAGSKG